MNKKEEKPTSKTTKKLGSTGDTNQCIAEEEKDIWHFFRNNFSDYSDQLLYDSRGPWPSPSPGRPLSEAAEVALMPKEESDDWTRNVRPTYLKILFLKWPIGLWYAYVTHRSGYVSYEGNHFEQFISQKMYSKFLCPLDEGDKKIFSIHMEQDKEYIKMDFSSMEYTIKKNYLGVYTCPSITLFEKIKTDDQRIFKHRPICIYLNDSINENKTTLLSEKDDDRWELAKYYVVQGAVHRVNLTEHGRLHFPFDAVNAITKSILPMRHPLFKLLIPFLRLSLPVNNSVLESNYSMLSRANWVVYSPFCAPGKNIRELIKDGYVGRKNKPYAFPRYIFPAGKRWQKWKKKYYLNIKDSKPLFPETSFGVFLSSYYDIFYNFVDQFLQLTMVKEYHSDNDEAGKRNWELIALWAECISEWVPGFPDRLELLDEKNPAKKVVPNTKLLTQIITLIMWNLSIAHAADHDGFGHAGPTRNVFRIRIPPPFEDNPVPKDYRRKLVNRWDIFQSWLTHEMFYKPHNVTYLKDVQFDFDFEYKKKLDALADQFRQDLKNCDKKLYQQYGDQLTRLDSITPSIQY